jgi:hypothetical protein
MKEIERPSPDLPSGGLPPGDLPSGLTAPPDDAALRAAGTLARWLDRRYVDPLLGFLLPGVGDLLSAGLGMYPVLLAWRRRAPKALVARMILNLAADAAGGSIPILGDLWDFLFKAHARNHELLRSRLHEGQVRSRASDTLIIIAALLALAAALSLPILVAVGVWRFVAGRMGG